MNRPDLFLTGGCGRSFTDVLADMSDSLKSIATVLSDTKKRPRNDRNDETSETLGTIVAMISAFQKISAEEEHIDPDDALELLVDVKNKCMKIIEEKE